MSIAVTVAITLVVIGLVELFCTPAGEHGGGFVPLLLGIAWAVATGIFYAGMMAAK
jgi:hypothetical protein